jgi:hypothetical protein
MRKAILLTFLLMAWISSSAQSKSSAMKFDEFQVKDSDIYYRSEKAIDNYQRIDRFFNLVKSMRGIKVYLIYYRARKNETTESRILENWVSMATLKLQNETKLGMEGVLSVDGGYRDAPTIEFWIVPKGALPPTPTPLYGESQVFNCPNIRIVEGAMNLDLSKTAAFSVITDPEVKEIAFNWSVSAGKIVRGQGTKMIEVDTAGNKEITVFTEAEGFPLPCNRTAVQTFEVGKRPILIGNMVRFNSSYYSALVDELMIRLNDDPTSSGCVIIYGGRQAGASARNRMTREAKKPFIFRRYDLGRITIIDGGYREYSGVDLWMVPPNTDLPTPTPSVDQKLIKPPAKMRRQKGS